jgi:Domain of unknown function (DUF3786)
VSPSRHDDPSGLEERRRRTIAAALDEIRELNLEDQAIKGGFSCENLDDGNQRIVIPSFGDHLEIIMPDGKMSIPGLIDSLTLRVLALRYIKLSCGIPASGEWIAYRDLPGGRFYAATLVPTVEMPIAQAFGGDHRALGKAAHELGAENASFGDESYIFHPFPYTPLLLVCHWGDEEFPPQCRILFDRCCSHYLNTDDLKILATQVAAYLLKQAGIDDQTENMLWMVE